MSAAMSIYPPDHNGATPRGASIGDRLAQARASLARALDDARDVVRLVTANLPDDLRCSLDVAGFAIATENGRDPLDDAGVLLRHYLNRFKGMVFNGSDSARLAVSGSRLNKVSRRLCEAAERFAALSAPIQALKSDLAGELPGYSRSTYERAAIALLVLDEWDARPKRDRLSSPAMARGILESVERDGKIRLALFVCPPVDFSYISGERPEHYLRTAMHGSLLSRQVDRLRALFGGFEGAGLDVGLIAFIGDTDEEEYLWQGIARPDNLDNVALEAQREELVRSVTAYMTTMTGKEGNHPRIIQPNALTVARMSAIPHSRQARNVYEAIVISPLDHFTLHDLRTEATWMRKLWEPGAYYHGLDAPGNAAMTKIVVHKFATYAMQGMLMLEYDPDLVLIQTERPSALRNKMLNAGRGSPERFPLTAVNFFEPEEGRQITSKL